MAFHVIPAIDVAGGRLVRASGGDIQAVGAFGGAPIAAARAFVDAGATWLHVVDVDRANGGRADVRFLREIVALGVPVQASGGIASHAALGEALDAGAARAVIGSAMLADRELVESVIARFGPAVVVGIEADGDVLRPRSTGAIAQPLAETLEWTGSLEVARYLYTGVRRVSGLGGPDLEGIAALASRTGRPVLAAGGIAGVKDVRAVRALGGTVEGAVLGRALYEGLDLRDVLTARA